MRVSHDLCITPNTNWSRDHLECDHNTQDLSSVGTDLVELHDRPRSVGRTEVFMECDWGLSYLTMNESTKTLLNPIIHVSLDF